MIQHLYKEDQQINRENCLLNQSFSDGFCYGLRLGIDMEFFVDIINVGSNGSNTDTAIISNHLVTVTIYEAFEYF